MCTRANVTGRSAPHAARHRFPSPMDIGLQVLMVRLMAHPIEAHHRCGRAPPRSLHSALLMHLPAGPLSEVQAHRECACSDLGGEHSLAAPRSRAIRTCRDTSCPNPLASPMRTRVRYHPWPHRYMSIPITFHVTSPDRCGWPERSSPPLSLMTAGGPDDAAIRHQGIPAQDPVPTLVEPHAPDAARSSRRASHPRQGQRT